MPISSLTSSPAYSSNTLFVAPILGLLSRLRLPRACCHRGIMVGRDTQDMQGTILFRLHTR